MTMTNQHDDNKNQHHDKSKNDDLKIQHDIKKSKWWWQKVTWQ